MTAEIDMSSLSILYWMMLDHSSGGGGDRLMAIFLSPSAVERKTDRKSFQSLIFLHFSYFSIFLLYRQMDIWYLYK